MEWGSLRQPALEYQEGLFQSKLDRIIGRHGDSLALEHIAWLTIPTFDLVVVVLLRLFEFVQVLVFRF